MNPFNMAEVSEARKARRALIASLSIDERMALIEMLRDLGKVLIATRKTLPESDENSGES